MEIEELKKNQNIIANKLIEIQKESRELKKNIEKDLEKIKNRDTKITEELRKAKEIVDTFSKYQRTFEQTNFLNKIFAIIIFLFFIFLIWGSLLINFQSKHIKQLEKTLEDKNNAIVQVLLENRKFWVDNNDNIKWDLIKNIPNEIKNPKIKNQKKEK